MITPKTVMSGIVRGGVVVPDETSFLPEGTKVEIYFPTLTISAELQEEFAGWDRASAQAWEMIDVWEKEAQK